MERFGAYTYVEARTGMGQLVNITCPTTETEKVKEFFRGSVREVDLPATHRVNVKHGGYGRYTRFDIVQHKYAGGGHPGFGGFIEVLEIKNPPDGRHGVVVYEHRQNVDGVRAMFAEWDTLEAALAAFEQCWGGGARRNEEKFPTLPGFKRLVQCGALSPWFYAIGDEALVGDYAFPDGLQDDPVFRFGRKFVVPVGDGGFEIKTCMGARFYSGRDEYDSRRTYQVRLVYWHDGSVWADHLHKGIGPQPLAEHEAWIEEAVKQFQGFLSGKTSQFSINFMDGSKFLGKMVPAKRPREKSPSKAAGDYNLRVWIEGETKSRQGWINDFVPTPEIPDIVAWVKKEFAGRGKTLTRIEILNHRRKKGGKRWTGVFFSPPQS